MSGKSSLPNQADISNKDTVQEEDIITQLDRTLSAWEETTSTVRPLSQAESAFDTSISRVGSIIDPFLQEWERSSTIPKPEDTSQLKETTRTPATPSTPFTAVQERYSFPLPPFSFSMPPLTPTTPQSGFSDTGVFEKTLRVKHVDSWRERQSLKPQDSYYDEYSFPTDGGDPDDLAEDSFLGAKPRHSSQDLDDSTVVSSNLISPKKSRFADSITVPLAIPVKEYNLSPRGSETSLPLSYDYSRKPSPSPSGSTSSAVPTSPISARKGSMAASYYSQAGSMPAPEVPLPPVPPFISVYFDPSTGRIPTPAGDIPFPGHQSRLSQTSTGLRKLASSARQTENHKGREGGSVSSKYPPNGKGRKRADSNASKWSFGVLSGRNSRHSWSQLDSKKNRKYEDEKSIASKRRTQDWLAQVEQPPPVPNKIAHTFSRHNPLFRRKLFWIPLILLIIGIILAGTLVSLLANKHAQSAIGDCVCENGGSATIGDDGSCSCSCSGAWRGSYCQLDSTCQTVGDQRIASALVNIASNANTFLQPAIDNGRMAAVFSTYLGTKGCGAQVSMLDLPNLPPRQQSSRLLWAQSIILWTFVMTEAPSPLADLIKGLDFTTISTQATPANTAFQVQAGGYMFDVAAMKLTTPRNSWASSASPSEEQIALVSSSSTAPAALDRITSSAVAASTQRSQGLAHYWAELGFSTSQLKNFRRAVANSPAVFPFDPSTSLGSETVISAASAATSFPPAVGCLPSLTGTQINTIEAIEVDLFGLPAVSNQHDSVCIDRPLYGAINLLNLRTPFSDSDPRLRLPQQGVVAMNDNKIRMSLHAGELLLGTLSGAPTTPTTPQRPQYMGIVTAMDHVLLDYLMLMDKATATLVINHVLGASTTPFDAASEVLNAIPVLEVQLWGGLRSANVERVYSGLMLSNGETFFGSDLGDTFRTWVASVGAEVQWSVASNSKTIVADDASLTTPLYTVWRSTSAKASAAAIWNSLNSFQSSKRRLKQ